MKMRLTVTFLSIFLLGQVAGALPSHPRLLMMEEDREAVEVAVSTTPCWSAMHKGILSECEALLKRPVLRVSSSNNVLREGLKRIFFLSYAWRITHDARYADRAIAEMTSVCSAEKWNGEYLGIAELAFGVGIGYDWLYDCMDEEKRMFISDALVRLGIEPSFGPDGSHFLKSVSNWNLVCNTGVTVGALSVGERYPELLEDVLERTLASLYMAQYYPDGAYPEGYGYWGYGTGNLVCLIDILRKVYGTDFGLSGSVGFMDTPEFILNMVGNSGCSFNFSDAKPSTVLNPAMFWFAAETGNLSLLWNEKKILESGSLKEHCSYRMAPLSLIWGAKVPLDRVCVPDAQDYYAGGVTPVYVARSGWDKDDIYIAMKGGTPLAGHAHMDIGSFVLDAEGERWVTDLGSPLYGDGYFTLKDADEREKALVLKSGIEYLKVTTPDSPRWNNSLAGPFTHSIVTVDSSLVEVRSRADFIREGTLDLTQLYSGKFKSYQRRVFLNGETSACVDDVICCGDAPVNLRWAILTDAEIQITGQRSAVLLKNGKRMNLFLDTTAEGSLDVEDGGTPPRKGGFAGKCRMITFRSTATAGSEITLKAVFTPGRCAPQSGVVNETVLAVKKSSGPDSWWNDGRNLNSLRLPPPLAGTEIRYIDINGDGKVDVLRTISACGTPVQWIDDNGNMELSDVEGDMVDDCLMVDRNRDGVFGSYDDITIDWTDLDGDGKADLQTVVENVPFEQRGVSGGGHYMMVFDLDKDNVFNYIDWSDFSLRCWWHRGESDFYTDYNGNSEFLKVHSTPERLNDVSLNWENPFLFIDPDGDGLTEMTVRLCDSRFNCLNNPDGGTKFSKKIDWAAVSVDMDNDNSSENPFDLDMTLCFRSRDGNPYGSYVNSWKRMRGLECADDYFLDPGWRRNTELVFPHGKKVFDFIFRSSSWDSVAFTYDEDDDCKRWERVELYTCGDLYATGEGNGGLDDHRQSDVAGDRGEWDMDNSGKGRLYISPLDGRIHLFGAEKGAWRIDQSARYYQGMGGIYDVYGPGRSQAEPVAPVPVVRYEDCDGNGFFDTISYDWDADGVFEETETVSGSGKDTAEVYDTGKFSYRDYCHLFRKAAEGLWKRAGKLLSMAEHGGFNTSWYAVYRNPKSLRQKYDFGYWLTIYLEHDMELNNKE